MDAIEGGKRRRRGMNRQKGLLGASVAEAYIILFGRAKALIAQQMLTTLSSHSQQLIPPVLVL